MISRREIIDGQRETAQFPRRPQPERCDENSDDDDDDEEKPNDVRLVSVRSQQKSQSKGEELRVEANQVSRTLAQWRQFESRRKQVAAKVNEERDDDEEEDAKTFQTEKLRKLEFETRRRMQDSTAPKWRQHEQLDSKRLPPQRGASSPAPRAEEAGEDEPEEQEFCEEQQDDDYYRNFDPYSVYGDEDEEEDVWYAEERLFEVSLFLSSPPIARCVAQPAGANKQTRRRRRKVRTLDTVLPLSISKVTLSTGRPPIKVFGAAAASR